MNRIGIATVVLFQLVCLHASAQQELTIEHQGTARHALLHAPSPMPAGKMPVLIYLHGARPPGWKNHTQNAMDTLADREGVLAVYPEAVGFRWNHEANVKEPQKISGGAAADDLGFMEKLIGKLIAENNADPARVYVLGDSRGGLMTFYIMCSLADRIAAAGPWITGMTIAQVNACNPTRAVPLMTVAGTDDTWQNYDGFLAGSFRLLSMPETMEFWRVRHGCTGLDWKILPHRLADDPTRIMLTEWTGCTAAGAVKFYRVNGGGHQVPRFEAGDPEWIAKAGLINHDIETVEEFWTFARKFKN